MMMMMMLLLCYVFLRFVFLSLFISHAPRNQFELVSTKRHKLSYKSHSNRLLSLRLTSIASFYRCLVSRCVYSKHDSKPLWYYILPCRLQCKTSTLFHTSFHSSWCGVCVCTTYTILPFHTYASLCWWTFQLHISIALHPTHRWVWHLTLNFMSLLFILVSLLFYVHFFFVSFSISFRVAEAKLFNDYRVKRTIDATGYYQYDTA